MWGWYEMIVKKGIKKRGGLVSQDVWCKLFIVSQDIVYNIGTFKKTGLGRGGRMGVEGLIYPYPFWRSDFNYKPKGNFPSRL